VRRSHLPDFRNRLPKAFGNSLCFSAQTKDFHLKESLPVKVTQCYPRKIEIYNKNQRWQLVDSREEPTLQGTSLLKPVLEDTHRLSFIRTYKDLLLYKAAEQFLKQKYADELSAEELVMAF